jgi:serine/threonine-protein kinase
MSPEQAQGREVDKSTDIWAISVVLYELVTGEPPFTAPTVTQLMHQVATATPRPPSATNPAVPAMLDLIVARALQKQPAERYQSAAEFASDLRSCLAELTGGRSPQPAGPAPAPPKAGAATVAQAGVPLEKTAAAGEPTIRTATSTVADAATHLALSRKFDSAAALQLLSKLAEASGADGADQQGATPRRSVFTRLWRYPGRLLFAVAVLAASATAYYIAYY